MRDPSRGAGSCFLSLFLSNISRLRVFLSFTFFSFLLFPICYFREVPNDTSGLQKQVTNKTSAQIGDWLK